MNAGVTTAWAMVTAGILIATGWKKQLLDDVPPLRAAGLAAALLAACGLAGEWLRLPAAALPQGLAVLGAFALLRHAGTGKRLQAVAGAVLGSIVWIWLRKLYAADPVFILWDAQLDGPLAAGFLAAAAAGHFRAQFAAIAAASIAAHWAAPAAGGAWAWLDGLLAALCTARAATALARGAAALAVRLRPQAGRGE
jgi:hypothetical protein